LLSHGERNAEQRRWVRSYFQREVQPLLVPVGLDPAHPFPQVANKSLNFIVQLSGKDAFGRANEIAIVKVPRVLPRVIPLPDQICEGSKAFVLLSSVIRAHLAELFPGREVGQFSQFRVTRHSELAVDEDEIANLRMALRQGLQHAAARGLLAQPLGLLQVVSVLPQVRVKPVKPLKPKALQVKNDVWLHNSVRLLVCLTCLPHKLKHIRAY
jgi:polyphosphate kinase